MNKVEALPDHIYEFLCMLFYGYFKTSTVNCSNFYNKFFNQAYFILFISVTFVDSRTKIAMTRVYALKKTR